MGVETILLAVGEADEHRLDEFVRPTIDVAKPTGATVVIGHVFDEEAYDRAIDEIEEATEQDAAYEGFAVGEPIDVMNTGFGVTGYGGMSGMAAGSEDERTVDTEEALPAGEAEAEATDVDADGIARRYGTLRELANALEDAGVGYEIRGKVGDPAEGILEMATDVDADLIIVGGRDRSVATETLFGSVSREIIESARSPVISVREGTDGR